MGKAQSSTGGKCEVTKVGVESSPSGSRDRPLGAPATHVEPHTKMAALLRTSHRAVNFYTTCEFVCSGRDKSKRCANEYCRPVVDCIAKQVGAKVGAHSASNRPPPPSQGVQVLRIAITSYLIKPASKYRLYLINLVLTSSPVHPFTSLQSYFFDSGQDGKRYQRAGEGLVRARRGQVYEG